MSHITSGQRRWLRQLDATVYGISVHQSPDSVGPFCSRTELTHLSR